MNKPKNKISLRHVALYIKNLDACRNFYTNLLGLEIVWEPDQDNLYLSTGDDNLALHRDKNDAAFSKPQRLDHLGFFLAEAKDVDTWYEYMLAHGVEIVAPPKDHRDKTRSFYCKDPDGNVIQMIYYPLK